MSAFQQQSSADSCCWLRGDDVLVSVSGVEWVAKNVFIVSIPAYRRKVSCELTAVDVPRGTAAPLMEGISEALRKVNTAMRVYLRQDFYSNFPLEGFGDIIFSEESQGDVTSSLHWCSLQETLVTAGVACIVRPSVVRYASLLDAEFQCLVKPQAKAWLSALHQRERSPLFLTTRRCVVEDVMRGDVYRVSWIQDQLDTLPADYPEVLILEATVCHTPSRAKGFAALRWAQTHLLHRTLVVDVHGIYPSDKDVAYNTQLDTYEHLANARGTARVVVSGGSGEKEEEQKDVGEMLVRSGLGWVRQVSDAGVPRASNVMSLYRFVGAAMAASLSQCAESKSGEGPLPACLTEDTCQMLARAWHLPRSAVASLLAFHSEWWARRCCRQLCSCPSEDFRNTAGSEMGTTRQLWATVLWCGDLHQDPHATPQVYVHRPLRTIIPLAALAVEQMRLNAYVEGAALVNVEGGTRAFLQVEVTVVASPTEWKDMRRSVGYGNAFSVDFSPSPWDAEFSRRVRVFITTSDVSENTEIRLKWSCQKYDAKHFLLSNHKPSENWETVNAERCDTMLSLRGEDKVPMVFVLDVKVEGRDENCMQWTQRGLDRAVYFLHPGSGPADRNEVDIDDNGDPGDNVTAARSALAVATPAARTTQISHSPQWLSRLSFFFELDPCLMTERDAATDRPALHTRLGRAFSDLVYEDVLALPVGVAEVNGVRGLVGDLLFPSEPVPRVTEDPFRSRSNLVFNRSMLTTIGSSWWPSKISDEPSVESPHWPMTSTVWEEVRTSFCSALKKVEEEEWLTRKIYSEEVEYEYRSLHEQARNSFPMHVEVMAFSLAPVPPPLETVQRRCLSLAAGDATLWRDSTAGTPNFRLASKYLPSTVPLSMLAVAPRALICVPDAHERKVISSDKQRGSAVSRPLTEDSRAHPDWIFMRLGMPRLPNLQRCDWERLPLSLRNSERALCERIARDDISTRQIPGMLYTTERIFSSFLSYLALLQSVSSTAAPCETTVHDEDSPLTSIFGTFKNYAASVLENLNTCLSFSATLFVLPPITVKEGETRQPHSRPLFLGSRANNFSDLFEVPCCENASLDVAPFPFQSDAVWAGVSAVGTQAFLEKGNNSQVHDVCARNSRGAADMAEVQTIAGGSLQWGQINQDHTPVLYHPLPNVSVLGSPLVERDEYSPDALGRLELRQNIFDRVAAEAATAPRSTSPVLTRKRIGLRYVCFPVGIGKNPYKSFSYGRVSKRIMYETLLRNRSSGGEVQQYMSLLLRQSRRGNSAARAESGTSGNRPVASTFPDGELTVYGVPSDPLYLHYRSRADLRFSLSTVCPSLQEKILRVEKECHDARDSEAFMDDVETGLLRFYATAASGFTRRIYEHLRRKRASYGSVEQVYLSFRLQTGGDVVEPYLAIEVFPVEPSDAIVQPPVLDQRKVWQLPALAERNPYRPFSLQGSRYGRLASCELRVTYNASTNEFEDKWNPLFEDPLL